ncbi:MAG: acyl-CoA dehydrogenase family protein [Planctomycetota bacterium]
MKTVEEAGQTFVEPALKLSGKSEEEAKKTGSLDRADEHMEALFSPKFQTTSSPIHRAIWDKEIPLELFIPDPPPMPANCKKVMEDAVAVVRGHQKNKTIYEPSGVISAAATRDLGAVGYWGMLVSPEFGGIGAPISAFCEVLTRMITVEGTLAGWASIHTGIGAVDPLGGFGTPEQKKRFLPILASGKKLSGFALTEPGAGSDLTALKTRAVLQGDHYVVNGEKLFITNAFCGRIITLIALIDNRPAALIVELPEEENEHFQLVKYKLHCLEHSTNNGLRFRDFKVPKENLVKPPRGDGLTVAYHGLNNGRVALCAMAAGGMRVMLANMLPWARFRKTYGAAIDTRELVERRMGRLAAMIVGCDALVAWCSTLLHQGYRGEMECIIAKIFGSESQKEAALELLMKTHGGRAFLHGHLFGDNVCEYLALHL